MSEACSIAKLPHHEQQKLCQTRAPYRQGRKLTAVKVYTINNESQHLMISGVPKLQLSEEMKKLVLPYGDIKNIELVSDYPTEAFTEAYHVHYVRIQSARIAKRFIDGKNFYGGLLHVFYVPELETVAETRIKLIQRRKDVATRIKRNRLDLTKSEDDKFITKKQYHRKKKTPALPLTEDRLTQSYPGETLSSIYNGIPQSIDPRQIVQPCLPGLSSKISGQQCIDLGSVVKKFQMPCEASSNVLRTAGVKECKLIVNEPRGHKQKNYKGQSIKTAVKVKVVRPQLIDTRDIAKWSSPKDTKIFNNIKKVNSGITIKAAPQTSNEKKKIVIKNQSITQLLKPSEDLQFSIQSAKCQIRAALQKSNVT